jgi:plastocyanin
MYIKNHSKKLNILIYRNNKKRCMKKILVVLAILFIGILLAGCTSQPAKPVATTVPTAVPTPVVTVPPTPVPTKEVIVVVVNKTANVTAAIPNVTATPVPTYTITFTQDLTILPSATATVKVGTKVIWANTDPYKPHSIMSDDVQTQKYFGGLSTVEIPYGKTYEVVFDKVGAYGYTTGPFQPQTQGNIVVIA